MSASCFIVQFIRIWNLSHFIVLQFIINFDVCCPVLCDGKILGNTQSDLINIKYLEINWQTVTSLAWGLGQKATNTFLERKMQSWTSHVCWKNLKELPDPLYDPSSLRYRFIVCTYHLDYVTNTMNWVATNLIEKDKHVRPILWVWQKWPIFTWPSLGILIMVNTAIGKITNHNNINIIKLVFMLYTAVSRKITKQT